MGKYTCRAIDNTEYKDLISIKNLVADFNDGMIDDSNLNIISILAVMLWIEMNQ